jgi:hypothetical protein
LEPLLACPDRSVEPVLLRGKGTSIFFVIGAEGVIGSIKIHQHLVSWHGLDIKVAAFGIGLRNGGFVFERKKKLPFT